MNRNHDGVGTKMDSTFKRLRISRPVRGAAVFKALEIALLMLTLAAIGYLLWVIVAPSPRAPVQHPAGIAAPNADLALLTHYDPFSTSGPVAASMSGTLPVKLFGIRADRQSGGGSAILEIPGGLQASFGINEEIVPGMRLKAVAADHVIIARGGSDIALFLDQTMKAEAAIAQVQQRPGKPVVAVFAGLTAQSLKAGVKLTPQMAAGRVSGFTVTPGAADGFAATGLQPGDVITEINGGGFNTVQEITDALGALPPGTPVTLSVIRAGNAMTLGTRALQ